MLNRILSTALIALLVLTACDTEPGPADWCYNYDFALSNLNSDGDPIGITAGAWEEGTGLLSVNNELVVSWSEPFFTRPVEVSIAFSRLETGTALDVGFQAVVFGAELAYQESIAAEYPGDSFGGNFPISSDGSTQLEEGNAVQFVVQTSAPIALHMIQIRGVGVNPFPRDDCAPPEETPTPPVTSTVGPTNTPTDGPSPTPVPCNTVIWTFDGTSQNWELIRNPSWSNSIYAPNLAQDFVYVLNTGGIGGGYIGDGNQHGTTTVKRGIGAGIYDLNLPGNCNIQDMSIYWRSNGSGSASVRMRLLVDGSWFDPTGAGNLFGFSATGGTIAWRGYDFQARGYTIPLNDVQAIEFASYEWYETQIFEVRINPQPPSGPTEVPTSTTTLTPTRTALFIPSPTPSSTIRPTLALQTQTFTPQATPSPGTGTPTIVPTFIPPPTDTPGPTNTPWPTLTPRATITMIPPPTQHPSITPVVATIEGPALTPLPTGGIWVPGTPGPGGEGTAVFGTPDWADETPIGTFIPQPSMQATYLPTPQELDGSYQSDVESSLGTAVAYVNQMPSDIGGLMPGLGNLDEFAGYGKGLVSGVSLQEIFGRTLYPIPQHALYGVFIIFFIASIRVIWRLVQVFIKFAVMLIRWILKAIPFIG
jgi:hypothetical protein